MGRKNTVMEMGIPRKRRRGRPIGMWMGNIREDVRDVGLEEENAGDKRQSTVVTR